MVWSRDVRVPLRQCDYETPIIARRCPFERDSPEDDIWSLSLSLAAAVLLYAPFFRRFKQWPIHETRNGVKGHLVIQAAYGELRRQLIEFGYSEKDFERASWPDIAEFLAEGDCRRETEELFADIVLGQEKVPCSPECRDAAKNWALRKEGARPMTKSGIADGGMPLTTRAKIIKDKLLSLEEGVAMTLPKIQEWYETQANLPKDTPKTLDEGTWKRVRKELLPYGLKNARGSRGYYFPK